MTNKKHPEVDLSRQRSLIFQICLVCILLIANIAFEWRSYDDFDLIDITNQEYEILNQAQNISEQLPSPPNADTSQKIDTEIYEQGDPVFSVSLDFEE
jgi:hypothetical protein